MKDIASTFGFPGELFELPSDHHLDALRYLVSVHPARNYGGNIKKYNHKPFIEGEFEVVTDEKLRIGSANE
jgi:hypothetical protein